MAGITDYETVQDVDGISFVPMLLHTGTSAGNRNLYWHYPNKWGQTGPGVGGSCTIRKGDWKLIYFFKDQHFELYNIFEDIGEHHNLVDENPEKTKELAEYLGNHLRNVDAQRPVNKQTGKVVDWPDEIP